MYNYSTSLQARYLKVEEPVTQAFVEEELPQLSDYVCLKILKMTAPPVKLKTPKSSPTDFGYILVSTRL